MILDRTSVYRGKFLGLLGLAALVMAGRAGAEPVGCVESADLPIRVCYDRTDDLELASEVVQRAEGAWEFYVDGLGFPQPWRLTDEGTPEQGLYFLTTDLSYLGDFAMGWAEPVADVPSTPHSDCAVRININNSDEFHFSRMIVPHEVARALLMADDCAETLQEGLPMYLYMVNTKLTSSWPFDFFLERVGEMYLAAFQANPHFAIDYVNTSDPNLESYPSGMALYYMYLDERFSDGRGGIFNDIAAATRQDGTVVIADGVATLESGENEPDLLDAVDAVLLERDGSFWDSLKEFALWRLFTFVRDDGAHFDYAAVLPELAIDSSYEMSGLPVSDMPPMRAPAETGATYINVYVNNDMVTSPEDLLQLSITSSDSMNWHLAAVVFMNDGTNTVHEADATDGRGIVMAPELESASNVIFVALNMGDLVHDPDNPEFDGADLTFDIDLYTTPMILSVSPNLVMTGARGTTVEITGTEFKSDIIVDLGEGITVTSRTVESRGDMITAVIDVAGDAPLGLRPVRVSYANGLSAELADAIEVISGEPPVLAEVSPPFAATGTRLNVELVGDMFQNGLTVDFSGDIVVRRMDFINEGSAIALIEVSPDAVVGTRDVTVTNPDGKSVTLPAGFEVLPAPEPDLPVVDGDGENGGCGCAVAGSGTDTALPCAALLLLALAAVLFRRKKPGKPTLMVAALVAGLMAVGSGSAEAAPDSDVSAKIARIYELLYPGPAAKSTPQDFPLSSYTAKRVEAFRILKSLPEEEQDDLQPLFAPPLTLGCLESEIYPARSCYRTEDEIPRAEVILTWVEETWQVEVDELGFWVPWRYGPEGPEPGMDFYLEDASSSGASGYTSPEGFVSSTPNTDCHAYIVIDEDFNPSDNTWKTVVGHELNHGCQMAMDCYETITSMESTATWIEPVLQEGVYDYFAYAISAFQAEPGMSVGGGDYGTMYIYGAGLFIQFVQEYIGDNDPMSIARLWEGTVQNTEANEPDLLDEILALAAESDIDLAGLFSTFGEWRWFVGPNDDGSHFEHGAEWDSPWADVTVALNGTMTIPTPERFPVTLNGDIEPLGYLYQRVHMNTDTIPPGALVIRFQGVAASTWDMELWLLNDGMMDQKLTALSDEDGRAEIVAFSEEIFDTEDVIFMALNLGDEETDWDENWRTQHFSATFDYLYYPEIVEVDPRGLVPGEVTEVTLRGHHFEPDLTAQLSGEGAVITDTRVRSSEEVRLTILVGRDADFGPRDLVLNNYPDDYEGFETALTGAVEIIQPPAPYISAVDPGRGAAGQRHILRADGRYFSQDQWLSMSCPGVSITRVDFIDDATLFVHIEVPAEVVEQTCDLTIQDPFGHSFTLFDAFTVTAPVVTQDPVDDDLGVIDATGGACGCSLVR